MSQERVERVNELARTAQLAQDVAKLLFDVLPEVPYPIWQRCMARVEADVAVGTAITRSRLGTIWRESISEGTPIDLSTPLLDEPELDTEYAKDRLMLIEMVVRGDLHPEVLVPKLLTLKEKHPHAAESLDHEVAVYRRHPKDWAGALHELTESKNA